MRRDHNCGCSVVPLREEGAWNPLTLDASRREDVQSKQPSQRPGPPRGTKEGSSEAPGKTFCLSLRRLLPSTGHVPHLPLDQAPLSLCNLLSKVLEPYCSASESFLPPSLCQSLGSHRMLGLRNRLVWGTGSQSEPRSGCCPLRHSTVHSIIWTTSIVWTFCKYCSKKAFSPTG